MRADAWSYTYPDGPQNAEALLVDAVGTPLVITKPDRVNGAVGPHRIYRAPAGGGTLEFVREFRPPDPPIALQSLRDRERRRPTPRAHRGACCC